MAKSEYDCVEQFFLEEANLFLSETRLEDCVEVALKNAELPITLPMKFQEIRWKSVKELPAADPGFENRKGAQCFERSMENQPVRFALRELVDYSARARSALGL